MLENIKVNGIHMSRYIASWADSRFTEWLKTMGITDEKVLHDTWEMATCGKIELEISASKYQKAHKEEEDP